MCKRNILVCKNNDCLDFLIRLRPRYHDPIKTGLTAQDPSALGSQPAATPTRQRLPAMQGAAAASQEFGFT